MAAKNGSIAWAAVLLVGAILLTLVSAALFQPNQPVTWIPLGLVVLTVLSVIALVQKAPPQGSSGESGKDSLGCLPVLFMSIFACMYLANQGYRAVTAYGSHWQSVEAVVETWNLDEAPDGYSTEYSVWITYFYAVDGRTYRSRAATTDTHVIEASQFDETAYAALKRYPIGSTFQVFVNPRNPADSLFIQDLSVLKSVIFPIVMLAILVFLVSRSLRATKVWGVFRVGLATALSLIAYLYLGPFIDSSEPLLRTEASLRRFQSDVIKKRSSWDALKPGSSGTLLSDLGPPDEVRTFDDGTELWTFKMRPGLEWEGELLLRPGEQGLEVQRVSKPFLTPTSKVTNSVKTPTAHLDLLPSYASYPGTALRSPPPRTSRLASFGQSFV